MARKRSTPSDCLLVLRSFDVLYLLPKFFDFRFDLKAQAGNGQRFAFHSRRLGKHRVCFSVHFLKQEIELFAKFTSTVQQFPELLQVAPQTIKFLANVTSLSKNGRFLCNTSRINRCAAQQILKANIESSRKSRPQVGC